MVCSKWKNNGDNAHIKRRITHLYHTLVWDCLESSAKKDTVKRSSRKEDPSIEQRDSSVPGIMFFLLVRNKFLSTTIFYTAHQRQEDRPWWWITLHRFYILIWSIHDVMSNHVHHRVTIFTSVSNKWNELNESHWPIKSLTLPLSE